MINLTGVFPLPRVHGEAIVDDESNRVPRTQLPDHVTLTDLQLEALLRLEKLWYIGNVRTSKVGMDYNFQDTDNMGFLYFAAEIKEWNSLLLRNPNLDSILASRISNDLAEQFKDERQGSNDYELVRFLQNPAVYNDKELFKTIYEKFSMLEIHPSFNLFNRCLDVAYKMPIDSFMYLFFDGVEIASSQDRRRFGYEIEKRKEEVQAWFAENMPDTPEMPFAWLVRIYGFNIKGELA